MSSVVPEGWEVTPLGNVSNIYSGGTPSRSDASNYKGDIPWVKSGEVNQRTIRSTSETISERALTSSSTKWVEKGSVLVAMYGATAGKVARLMIRATINQAIAAVSAMPTRVSNDYLFHEVEFKSRNLLDSVQGSGQPNLSGQLVKELKVSIPPLPEQKKIASILTSVDEVIENTQKQIDKLQDLKKATMNELLTKGIGHTEFKDSELGSIPKSWEVKRLDEINFKIVVGYVGNVNDFYCDASEGVPFYRTQNIRPDRFVNKTNVSVTKDFHAKNNKSRIENGDVLIARVGANLGMVCEVKGVLGEANAANVIIINRREDYSSEFLSLFLNSEKGKGSILVDAMGGAQGVFNTTIAKSLLVPVTTKKEMSEIARVIASIQGSIAKQQNKLVQTQSLKKSLMQDLLTGKVRVTVN